jgi:methionine aminopeptidase
MKIIIAGGRNFTNYKKLCQICDQLLQDQTNIEIVSGAYYKGADKLGEQYAKERGYKITQFPANWKRYGKAAGAKRNQQMANYADVLIAFWDGKSRGTKHMIDLAKSNHLKVNIYYY